MFVPQTEEEKKQREADQQGTTGAPPTTSFAAPAPQQAVPGATAAAKAEQPKGSGSFSNLNKFIEANKGKSEQYATGMSTGLSENISGAEQGLTDIAKDTTSKIGMQTRKISDVNPEGLTVGSSSFNKIKDYLGGGYTGPETYTSDVAPGQLNLKNAVGSAAKTGTFSGLNELVGEGYKAKGIGATAGEGRFDTMLLNKDLGAKNVFAGLRESAPASITRSEAELAKVAPAVAEAKATNLALVPTLQGVLGTQEGKINTAIGNQLTTKQGELELGRNKIRDDIGKEKGAADVARQSYKDVVRNAIIGANPTYWSDIGQSQSAQAALNAAVEKAGSEMGSVSRTPYMDTSRALKNTDVMNTQQQAELAALSDLLGKPIQQQTSYAPEFNTAGYESAVSDMSDKNVAARDRNIKDFLTNYVLETKPAPVVTTETRTETDSGGKVGDPRKISLPGITEAIKGAANTSTGIKNAGEDALNTASNVGQRVNTAVEKEVEGAINRNTGGTTNTVLNKLNDEATNVANTIVTGGGIFPGGASSGKGAIEAQEAAAKIAWEAELARLKTTMPDIYGGGNAPMTPTAPVATEAMQAVDPNDITAAIAAQLAKPIPPPIPTVPSKAPAPNGTGNGYTYSQFTNTWSPTPALAGLIRQAQSGSNIAKQQLRQQYNLFY